MRALFECQLEHIRRYDRVKVECACGREVLLSLDAFAGLPSNTRVIDLKRVPAVRWLPREGTRRCLSGLGRLCGAARLMSVRCRLNDRDPTLR
jgi:hypothetical protein